jgi:hypothetical protein
MKMRRGCVSLGEIKCDSCQKPIPYPDRYLAVDEKGGKEDDDGDLKRYCIECCLKKGYAHYKDEKGEKILTFF